MNRSEVPPVRPFGHLDLPPQVVETLPGGMTFHRVSGGEQPVCRLTLYFTGGAAETGNQVYTRLTATAMTEATASFGQSELVDILDFNGARIAAAEHSHYTTLSLSMLNSKAPDLLPVLADMVMNPTFPADRIDTARLSLRTRIETMRHTVDFRAGETFDILMNGEGHPLSHPLTVSDAESFNADIARDVHRRLTATAKMHAMLSGALDDSLVGRVRDMLAALAPLSAGYSLDIVPFAPPAEPQHIRLEHPDTFQSAIVAGLPAIGRQHPDYIPLRYTVMALGGYFGSRLMRNIREDKGLTYGISAYLTGSQEGANVKISAQADKSYTDRVLDEIRAEMRRLAENPPCGDELERLRLYAMSTLAEVLDTPDSVMAHYATSLLVGTPPDYFELQQTIIRALTPDIIAGMARRYLDPSRLSTVVVGI